MEEAYISNTKLRLPVAVLVLQRFFIPAAVTSLGTAGLQGLQHNSCAGTPSVWLGHKQYLCVSQECTAISHERAIQHTCLC